MIEIILPASLPIGFRTVSVLENGAPASGELVAVSPSGKRLSAKLDADGSARIFFDEDGEWALKFLDEGRRVQVIGPAHSTGKSAATGLFPALNYASLLPFILILLAAALAFRHSSKRARFSKAVVKGRVVLAVRAGAPLSALELTDFVPAGCNASSFSEPPSVCEETVFGLMFVWKRAALAAGQEWHISYAIDAPARTMLRPAQLVSGGSNKIVLKSAAAVNSTQ